MAKYTQEYLIECIKQYFNTYNNKPVASNFHTFGYPHRNTYIRYFGSWYKAIELSDILSCNCGNCGVKIKNALTRVAESQSGYAFCSRSCSVTFSNKNRNTIKVFKKCKNCDNHVKRTNTCCSQICDVGYKYTNITKPKIENGMVSNRKTLKNYLVKERGYECSICQNTEWFGQPIPLEVDHIDGNAGNNFPINIRLICLNCHGLTPTHKGKNRGKGRKSRGLPLN